MLHIFTASFSIFVLFLVCDFATGLLDLWRASKPKDNHPQILYTSPTKPAPKQTEIEQGINP